MKNANFEMLKTESQPMDIVERITKKYNVTISENSIEKFASILECKEFRKDEIILGQGQISRYMYVVDKGMIRQFYYKDGRDITEHFSTEGDIAACLESLFLLKPTNLLIEAIEPSVVYLLDYPAWKNLCDNHRDINNLFQSILETMLIISQRKADSWRFENAHERYNRFCREYPQVARRAPIAYIASYLLMTPETLSRVRSGSL